ncbi:chromate transporter [Hydrogenibacillus schlegelii]|uniref:Chromate transport protein n=1 Tax=Hydrogenibacillus schlegelii TaxID=1484 RepID=A0A179IL81_HYDSH|nr:MULTISPECIES: chromate transporter [Hydrogenibacillus]MBT9281645.1 chromate transporter [Hydrogenibacillus schlegelii]OAR03427.1 hypothetical protein SA87_01475 [Hydrogenibacillus schlegelii]PTQ53946.1 MAG: Chromate transport protein [Hydrogenibacillus schlegelii]QZA33321.1 chromate transporter [Hydrogenibacillus sp. N12]
MAREEAQRRTKAVAGASEERVRHIGRWRTAWALFLAFAKLSPVTFGGGFAVIPLLERELVDRHRFARREEIVDLFAVAQAVPGSIYVNVGTLIGYRLAGVLGAVLATAGALLPTILIMLVLAVLYEGLKANPYVEATMAGLRPAIVALIAYAGVRVAKTAVDGWLTGGIAVVTFGVLFFLHLHPVLVIVGGIVLGLVVGQWEKTRRVRKPTRVR